MEEERRAEDAATEGGRTGYEDREKQVEAAAEDGPDEKTEDPRVKTANGSIGDPKYQAGGLATGERGRQSGARIESGEEEPGEPGEDEL